MTYLPATVAGRSFHLYWILDLCRRKFVAWEAHASDAAEHAAQLVRRTSLAEALFRTAKFRSKFPARGFVDLEAARSWANHFAQWYSAEHRRSGIRYVSPARRHAGADHSIPAARHALYVEARQRHPAR